MSLIFDMNLSLCLNFYILQLVHATKNTEKMLIINEIMTVLDWPSGTLRKVRILFSNVY